MFRVLRQVAQYLLLRITEYTPGTSIDSRKYEISPVPPAFAVKIRSTLPVSVVCTPENTEYFPPGALRWYLVPANVRSTKTTPDSCIFSSFPLSGVSDDDDVPCLINARLQVCVIFLFEYLSQWQRQTRLYRYIPPPPLGRRWCAAVPSLLCRFCISNNDDDDDDDRRD